MIENNSRGGSFPVMYVARCVHPTSSPRLYLASWLSVPPSSHLSLSFSLSPFLSLSLPLRPALYKPICCEITLWWHLSLPRLELASCSFACTYGTRQERARCSAHRFRDDRFGVLFACRHLQTICRSLQNAFVRVEILVWLGVTIRALCIGSWQK